MNRLIAVFYFVLSLYGVEVGSTIVDRINIDGNQALHSKVVSQPGVARFECLRSASGRCYYTLFPRDCASAAAPTGKRLDPCATEPVKRFAVVNGGIRQVAGLQRYRICVSAEDRIQGPDCGMPAPIAAR